MHTARLITLRAAYAATGVLLCLAALIAHRHVWIVGGVQLPWGLALGFVAGYLAVRAAGLLDGGTAGAVCCAAGWAVLLFYLYGGRTEGDYLLAADWLGYSMIFGGLLAPAAGVFVSMSGPRSGTAAVRPTI